MDKVSSIDGIVSVYRYVGPDADPDKPNVLIELPHGATESAHLEHVKAMVSDYPGPRHDDFFRVNTDQGSPEYADAFARLLTDPSRFETLKSVLRPALHDHAAQITATTSILVVRSLLPRTIVDVNRTWEMDETERKRANLTGTVGSFITRAEDVDLLHDLYRRYQEVADAAYDLVCGHGAGYAFNLHTYAPISVAMVEDEYIVETLHRAYHPDNYPDQVRRPVVELITKPPESDTRLAPSAICDRLLARYEAMGVGPKENDPFPLHPATTAYEHSQTHPGRVLTMEISREVLAETYKPFEIMKISDDACFRFATPIAAAYLEALAAS